MAVKRAAVVMLVIALLAVGHTVLGKKRSSDKAPKVTNRVFFDIGSSWYSWQS